MHAAGISGISAREGFSCGAMLVQDGVCGTRRLWHDSGAAVRSSWISRILLSFLCFEEDAS